MEIITNILGTIEIWSPIIISLFALYVAYLAHKKTKKDSKHNFLNMLRDKVKLAKYDILLLKDKEYTNNEKIIFLEKIRDYLLYLGYTQEKKDYLDKNVQKKLFSLQSDVEDYTALIMNRSDIEKNKELVIDLLNNFLKKL